MNRLQTLFLAMLCSTLAAFGTTRYCSPTGSGDGSSIATAAAFDQAFAATSGGDTLYCLNGIYYRNGRITIGQSKQGTANHYTVIAAAEGHKPIFDFSAEAYGERGFVISTGVQYIHISGLTLRYSGKNALLNQGSYCLFENLDVYGNGDTGVQMKGGGYNIIRYCDSHDNFDYQTTQGTVVNYGGNADGFADKQYSGGPNHYIGCRAWNNSDDGWDFFQRNTSEGENLLEDCIAYNSAPASYDMSRHPRVQTDATWFAQFPMQVIDRYGNSITATTALYPNIGNGNGFKIGGDRKSNNIRLVRCLAIGCAARGFDQNNNAGAMTVFNCTSYQNGTNYGFSNIDGSSLTIRNCISFEGHAADFFQCPTVVSDHNSWNTPGVVCSAADFAWLDTTSLTQQWLGLTPQTMPLLHLAQTSDMIDAGVNVGLPYSGTAPDMGCYEFGDIYNYPATLLCTTDNAEQTVREGNSITPIVLQWGGGAEGVELTDGALPQGIVMTVDNENRAVALSGSIGLAGVYRFSVKTTQGDEVSGAKIDITIYVKPADAVQVAFLTIPNSASDRLILSRLNSVLDFEVKVLDASQSALALAGYDLLVISPTPASTAAGMMAAKGADIATLLLKPFQLKSTAWNWANAVNTSDHAINIVQPGHPIFQNLSSASLTLFSQHQTNAVTAVDRWYFDTPVSVLATAASNDGYQSIVEVAAGTDINGQRTTQPLLMLGVSEYSTAYLTDDALTLITNACYYLLGRPLPTALALPGNDIILQRNDALLTVSDAHGVSIYSPAGQCLVSSPTSSVNISALPRGIYIVKTSKGIAKINL